MGDVIQLFPQPSEAELLLRYTYKVIQSTQQLYPYYLDDDLIINGWHPLGFVPKDEKVFLGRHSLKQQPRYYCFRDEKSFHNDGHDGFVVYGRISDIPASFQSAVHLFYQAER